MRKMDRYLLINFVVAYVICFTSLVGLYVIIDMFSNADEFLESQEGTIVFIRRVCKYYFIHSFEYFNRLSHIITMVAAMTTLASLHRNNELVALLAAGIPTRRALVPVLFGALLVIGLGILNREIVLPTNSEVLQRMHEDIEANQTLYNAVHIDKNKILFRAAEVHRDDQRIEGVNVTLPMEVIGQLQDVACQKAYYRPDPESGVLGWLLVDPSPVQIVRQTKQVRFLEDGNLFIHSDITFSDMIRQKNWINYASTFELWELLNNSDAKDPQLTRIMIHNRLMQPVYHMLLVLIGIPFVLQWENRNIYRSIAISMLLCGLFFVVDGVAGYFASYQYVDPLTAAWVPVFTFGPIALSLFHRMGT